MYDRINKVEKTLIKYSHFENMNKGQKPNNKNACNQSPNTTRVLSES